MHNNQFKTDTAGQARVPLNCMLSPKIAKHLLTIAYY